MLINTNMVKRKYLVNFSLTCNYITDTVYEVHDKFKMYEVNKVHEVLRIESRP